MSSLGHNMPVELYLNIYAYMQVNGTHHLVCAHCGHARMNHVENKCLYDVTSYTPIELYKYQVNTLDKLYPTAIAHLYIANNYNALWAEVVQAIPNGLMSRINRHDIADYIAKHLLCQSNPIGQIFADAARST